MGQDKALLQLAGRSLLELALDKLRTLPLAAAPRIAGAPSEHAGVVADLHPGCGPLSGIEAALAASTQALNVFLPVDMPLLPPEFLLWMLRRAQITGALVTVGLMNGLPQPLCAVYHKHLLSHITGSLQAGDRKVMPVVTAAAPEPGSIDLFNVERVGSAQPFPFSPQPLYQWFHNCNTPADMSGIEDALLLSQ
jgi:molybdopterin-guanine dinucleotide biosynthesis protein A